MIDTLLCFVGVLFGSLLFGLPVGFAIIFSSMVLYFVVEGGWQNPAIIVQRFASGVDSFPLLAVPLFMATGVFMNTSGITARIFVFANDLVGHFRLGLGQVAVVSNMIFAGMSGAAVADASGLGPILIKSMKDTGIKVEYAAAISAAASTIGPIIPPSIPLVVYGIMAQASIGRLLVGGIIPGVLIGLLLMAWNEIHGRRHGYARGKFVGFPKLWNSFRLAFFPLMTPAVLIGGILSGVFTPTEAAGVALAYSFFLGVFVYREATLSDFYKMTMDTMRGTAELLYIVGAAGAFAYVVISAGLPTVILDVLREVSGNNPWVILTIVNVFLLILGCFMEPTAAITIVVPVLMPVIHEVGISEIHFGLVVVYNLVIGLLTPPVGLLLFVIAKIADITVEKLVRAVCPFFVPLIAGLIAITYCPLLVTWLPDLLMGK